MSRRMATPPLPAETASTVGGGAVSTTGAGSSGGSGGGFLTDSSFNGFGTRQDSVRVHESCMTKEFGRLSQDERPSVLPDSTTVIKACRTIRMQTPPAGQNRYYARVVIGLLNTTG